MRKLRTRQHIIEDLGLNHFQRQVLKSGFVVQRYGENDYSYDGMIHTFDSNGESDNGMILFQLKSTDNIKFDKSQKVAKFDLSKRDLELWLLSKLTVLLVLYDAQTEIAYYIDLQEYFNENRILLNDVVKYVRVNIPTNNIVTPNLFLSLHANQK
jgi:Domain of unknown function (DUF4365)